MGTNRARRDALDGALEAMVEDGGVPRPDEAELVSLMETAALVRDGLRSEVPPGVAARHIAAAMTGEQPSPSARRRRRSRPLLVAIGAATMVILLGSSAVAASTTALPGDTFYGLKRAVERVRLALPGSDATKAELHLRFADERLAELQELLARRAAGEEVDVGAAMAAFEAELAKAEQDIAKAAGGRDDDAFLEHVLARIDRHVQRLELIRDQKVNERAREAIQRAIDNAEKAKGRVGHGRLGEGPGRGKPDGTPGMGPGNAPGQAGRGGPPAGS